MDLTNLSSNWKKLQATLKSTDSPKENSKHRHGAVSPRQQNVKRKNIGSKVFTPRKRLKSLEGMETLVHNGDSSEEVTSKAMSTEQTNAGLSPIVEIGKYVAIDCEMVGVGPDPDRDSALARVSIVNFNGEQIYDSFVKPKEPVTNWRTHISGIRSHHMLMARSLEQVQQDVAQVIDGKILVGHAIRHDLNALMLGHPKRDIRDTARHPPFRRFAGGGSPRLKILAAEILGIEIQSAEHSSVEDARVTMLLFRKEKDAFEQEHAKRWPTKTLPDPVTVAETPGSSVNKKKKKRKTKKKKKKNH